MKGNKRKLKSKRKIVAMIMVATLICMYTIPSFADSEADSQTEPVAENAPMVQAVVQGTFNGSPAELDENGDLLINEVNFPDATFRGYIKSAVDTSKNGTLTLGEVEACTEIKLRESTLGSVEGLKYFTSLVKLSIGYGGKLSVLDVSKNINLEFLACNQNGISELDISNNPKLTYLNCCDNRINKLDLSNNKSLTELVCAYNQLSELDTSENINLTYLYCGFNYLSEFDASKNMALTYLNFEDNNIKEFDASQNINLKVLGCSWNHITGIDLSGNTQLTGFGSIGQTAEGFYQFKNGKYVVDLNQFPNVNPDIVTLLDNGKRSANLVIYDEEPVEMNYNYGTGNGTCSEITGIKVRLTEGTQLENITVTYDPNGGNLSEVSLPTTEGTSEGVVLEYNDGGTMFSRDGYTFTGWNTASDGSGTAYSEGEKVVGLTSNITLYAQWSEDEVIPPGTPDPPGTPVAPITPVKPTPPTSTPNTGNGGNGGSATTLVSRVISTETAMPITGSVMQPEDTAKIDVKAEPKTVTKTPSKLDYGQEEGSWSLLSLILALGAILMGIGMLMRKSDGEKYRTNMSKAGAVVILVIGAILFFVLNDVASPMVFIKPTTAIFAVLAVLQLVNMLAGKAKYQYIEEQQ